MQHVKISPDVYNAFVGEVRNILTNTTPIIPELCKELISEFLSLFDTSSFEFTRVPFDDNITLHITRDYYDILQTHAHTTIYTPPNFYDRRGVRIPVWEFTQATRGVFNSVWNWQLLPSGNYIRNSPPCVSINTTPLLWLLANTTIPEIEIPLPIQKYIEIFIHGTPFFSCTRSREVYFCDRPEICEVDEQGRLHSSNGAALKVRDGRSYYVWKGIQIPEDIYWPALDGNITRSLLLNIPDQEERAAIIDMIGIEKAMDFLNAKLEKKDEYGELYSMNAQRYERRMRFVKVKNSSPEPDGTYKHYLLWVDPRVKTPKQAIASTFGLTVDDYNPIKET